VLRFGKSLEVFYGSLKSIHLTDAWLAFTLTVSKVCSSIFLLTDHIIWLARSGLVKDVDTAKWTQRSNKYWVISLVMNITRDVYEINRVVASFSSYKTLSQCIASSVVSIRSTKDVSLCFASLFDFIVTYKHLSIDTVKNCCDLFIPLTSMGYTKLSPRAIGLLGMISSIAGLIVILNPKCKLTPS
jgi:peroxin-11B